MEKLARITQRECDGASEVINVIARSVSDEAVHLFCRAAMDCFASLVMTAPWLFENGSGNHSLVIPGLRQDGASRNDEILPE